MDLARYILASLRHYRRQHVPVALGVAVATAVVTGALLVGDSVRGSLRGLTLERLGTIDQAVVTQTPFRAGLAQELTARFTASGEAPRPFVFADPAFLLRGSLSGAGGLDTRRYAGGVSVVGVSKDFGRHGEAPWAAGLAEDQVAITEPLAEELGVDAGDELVLRLPSVSALPADSPLGEKIDTTRGKRLTVAAVLPVRGLARFALAPSQAEPRNAFLSLAAVQSLLDQPGKANALLIDTTRADRAATKTDAAWLADQLRPTLEDYGITCEPLPRGLTDEGQSGGGPSGGDATQTVQIESDQLVLPPAVVDALADRNPARVTTYLANTLSLGERSIPYSTVTGLDPTHPAVARVLSGAAAPGGGFRPDAFTGEQIVLNDWAAERLGARVGDAITVTYYEPESTHGELVEAPPLTLKLVAIVPLTSDADSRPPADDPRLTPTLDGVTDADAISDWDLPFELVEPISRADEDYWDRHRTAPKAFVPLELAEWLWASRWGKTSLMRMRVPAGQAEQACVALRGAIDPAAMGFALLPVKAQGLDASAGATPFEVLFLGFSMFLIASAVMLIALLFGLGVEARGRELGLLSAVGWGERTTRRALVREGMITACLGAAIGAPAGIGYAWLMIWGLTTAWVEAIVTPFLSLHVTARAIVGGLAVGLLVAWLAIRTVTRRTLQQPPQALLAGRVTPETGPAGTDNRGRWRSIGLMLLGTAAAGLAALATQLGGEAQAGAFFGSGAATLALLVLLVHGWLRRRGERAAAPAVLRLAWLAWRNLSRSAGRSVTTIALVAAASFLLLAIGAFRLAPTSEGAGGFVLVGQTAQPLLQDLNTDRGRIELGLSRRDERLLNRFVVRSFRVHDGEDASCLNLYQTRQPRVLGVSDAFIERGGFAFTTGEPANPWRRLAAPGKTAPPEPKADILANGKAFSLNLGDNPVPVILDYNTATYSLKLTGVGSRLELRDDAGKKFKAVVVALLKNSLLQGDVLMSEQNFLRKYPSSSGSRFFLIEPSSDASATARDGAEVGGTDDGNATEPTSELAAELETMLESRLSDYGMDLQRADRRLAGFLAVQNTYLSTFQAIGLLGLLLGVVGVAVVQLRNVAQRRGELALLQASGFTPGRLRGLVLRENLLLLATGLGIGGVAAALVLAPLRLGGSASAATTPWATTLLLLAMILAVGVAVGAAATRSALRSPIVPALRGE
ncbi:MAG: FtsX-like permease family protein [Planctomycetota bacterium]